MCLFLILGTWRRIERRCRSGRATAAILCGVGPYAYFMPFFTAPIQAGLSFEIFL